MSCAYEEGCHLFESLCEVVQRIDDAVVIDDLVCIDRVVATTCTQYTVDPFSLCWSCTL